MTFMDRNYIKEHDVVQRYFHGKLSAEELVEFEKYMLLNPEIMEDVELTHTFKRALELSDTSAATKQVNKVSSFWQWIWPTGGVAVGALATWLLMGPLTVTQTQSPMTSPEVVYVETLRGVSTDPSGASITPVDKQSSSQLLIIDISSSAEQQATYEVTLLDQQQQLVKQWSKLTPNARGELIINTQLSDTGDTHWLEIKSNNSEDVVLRTKLQME